MAKVKKIAERNIFALRLESLIKENGYINETVAKGVEVTRQAVGNWVNGESLPDILTTVKLANFFDVSTDYLAGLTEIKSADPNIQSVCKFMGLSEKAIIKLIGSPWPNEMRLCDEMIAVINSLIESDFIDKLATKLLMLEKNSTEWAETCKKVIMRDGDKAYYASDEDVGILSSICNTDIFEISRLAVECSKQYDKRESIDHTKRNISAGELTFKKMKTELLAEMEADNNGEHNPPEE